MAVDWNGLQTNTHTISQMGVNFMHFLQRKMGIIKIIIFINASVAFCIVLLSAVFET